jgi:hypothetical protein
MNKTKVGGAIFAIAALWTTSVSAQSATATGDLAGTSWQLVKFQGSDDTTLTPDDKSKYTSLSQRMDGSRLASTAIAEVERGNRLVQIKSNLVRWC